MFSCCCVGNRVEECCRTWVREAVGYGEVGGQVCSLGCSGASNSLEVSHFSSTSWECDVTFLSAGVPITTWDLHLTAQVKPPMASWLRSSEPQSRWKRWKGKHCCFCQGERTVVSEPGQGSICLGDLCWLTWAPSSVDGLTLLTKYFPEPGPLWLTRAMVRLISRFSLPRGKSRHGRK